MAAVLGWTTLKHPLYSPDLAPCDYHLFGKLKGRGLKMMTPSCTLLKSGSDVLVQTFIVQVYRPSFQGGVRELKGAGIMWKSDVLFLKVVSTFYENSKGVDKNGSAIWPYNHNVFVDEDFAPDQLTDHPLEIEISETTAGSDLTNSAVPASSAAEETVNAHSESTTSVISGYTKTLNIVSKRIQVSSFDLDQCQKWMLERYEFNEENVSALKFLLLYRLKTLKEKTVSSQFTARLSWLVLLAQSLAFTESRTTDLQRRCAELRTQVPQLRSTALELRASGSTVTDTTQRFYQQRVTTYPRGSKFGGGPQPTLHRSNPEIWERNGDDDERREVKSIYEPCLPYLSQKCNVPLKQWSVIGLLFGSRGSISKFTWNYLKELHIPFDYVIIIKLWKAKLTFSVTEAREKVEDLTVTDIRLLRYMADGEIMLKHSQQLKHKDRPQKPFHECAEKSQKRKLKPLVETHLVDEITLIAEMDLRPTYRPDAAEMVKQVLSFYSERTPKMNERKENKVAYVKKWDFLSTFPNQNLVRLMMGLARGGSSGLTSEATVVDEGLIR
ncbi:hypothetical protein ANN_14098 [Periplaneta americana]|uniref:Uncharacterized protein n=1 Tax=Periplaneta americana TaxID=6978 RepID=A0ABQ8SVC8_PERAM|nr:hypothetical protein ANN_14098 [Periplaneta americana]